MEGKEKSFLAVFSLPLLCYPIRSLILLIQTAFAPLILKAYIPHSKMGKEKPSVGFTMNWKYTILTIQWLKDRTTHEEQDGSEYT